MAIILLFMSSVVGSFGEVESNITVAVVKGQSIRLPCKNDNPNETIHWYHYSLDNPKQALVYNNEEISSQFATRFSTDFAKPGQFDLLVNGTKITDAGKYECIRHISTPDRTSRFTQVVANAIQLTVLDNFPSCSYNTSSSRTTDGYVVENDFISMICSCNYSGNSRPVIKWFGQSQGESLGSTPHHFPISTNLNLYGATSDIHVHVSKTEEFLMYTCKVCFSNRSHLESATSYSQVSDHHFQCNLTFHVAYEMKNLEIFPHSSQYVVGDQLNCSADGKPNPKYEWSDLGTSKVIPGPMLTIEEDMVADSQYTFQCKASNQVAGETRSISRNITFIVMEKSRFPFLSVTLIMGILALILMIIVIYLSKEPIKGLVERLRPAAQVAVNIEPDIVPNAAGYQSDENREAQEYAGYVQPENFERERNSEMNGSRMPCDGREEPGPSGFKHSDNIEFPLYAEINETKKGIKSMEKLEVESSLSDASAKAECRNAIVGADGTEYVDTNTVKSLRDATLPELPDKEPLFNKSMYACIDHSVSPPPSTKHP